MSPSRLWPFRGPRAGLAFSGRLLVAVANGHTPHVTELPEELLAPSPAVPNVRSVAELARLVSKALSTIGARRAWTVLALPDFALTTVVLDASGRLGASEQLGNLTARLTYPPGEARIDFWRSGSSVLGAAIREAVARQYEQAIEAAECRLSWVDGASTARIPLWAGAARGEEEMRALVELYRSHYAIAVMKGRKLLELRLKLRSPGDAESVAGELARLPGVHASSGIDEIRLAGEDASRTAAALEGDVRFGRILAEDEGEERQLAAALESLLARSRSLAR